jgi:hypothetical protein
MGGIFNHINISKYKIKVLSEDNIKVMIGWTLNFLYSI